ncbi:MAG: hypothetical protein ACOC44_08260 [Promethearchaeia archaeon]
MRTIFVNTERVGYFHAIQSKEAAIRLAPKPNLDLCLMQNLGFDIFENL